MRKSYSKIRHIQESNTILESRRKTIMEQVPPPAAPTPAAPATPTPAAPATPAPVAPTTPPQPVTPTQVPECTQGVTGSLDATGILTKPDGTKCKIVFSTTPTVAG